MEEEIETYHTRLKKLIHEYVIFTYKITQKYPSDERFGLTSQDRRASVSVMLNYIEGYARMREKITLNFYEISYGSLKESIYIKFLAMNLGYISQKEYKRINLVGDEIGAMLFASIKGMRRSMEK